MGFHGIEIDVQLRSELCGCERTLSLGKRVENRLMRGIPGDSLDISHDCPETCLKTQRQVLRLNIAPNDAQGRGRLSSNTVQAPERVTGTDEPHAAIRSVAKVIRSRLV